MNNLANIQILAQLINAMNDSLRKLEEYYNRNDIENFNVSKRAVLEFQEKIDKMLA